MDTYQNLFNLFPNSESIALAGLYGLKHDAPMEFQLSDNIYIMARRDEFDQLYHPRMNKYSREPSHYLVGISHDNRYSMAFKKIETMEDVLASISIAHQSLCIFHSAPYVLGAIEGFSLGSMGSYGLSDPQIAGRNTEYEFDVFNQDQMAHPFHYTYTTNIRFDNSLKNFFVDVSITYVKTKEKRWMLSAIKYTSGMNHLYAEDVILDFAVSLESLLALDKEQISFKLRLYLALLVGNTYSERLQIYKDIKEFYNCRSTLVHGSSLKLKDEQINIIARVGNYLSKALIKTCGKNIKKEILPELEFMSLLGAPKLIQEKTQVIITEQELIDTICKEHDIDAYSSYRVYLSKEDDPDSDYTELLIDFCLENGDIQTFNASIYLSRTDHLISTRKFSCWLSYEEEKGYFYHVSF